MRLVSLPERLRAFVATGLAAAFLFALSLVASPQLHAYFHVDKDAATHECAATLIASGKCEQAGPPAAMPSCTLALTWSEVPTLSYPDVRAIFIGAAILEHAPPFLA